MKIIVFKLSEGDNIAVRLFPDGSGTVEHTFHAQSDDESSEEFDAAVETLTSMLLACACAGIDIDTPEFRVAVQTTVDAMANHYL